MGDRYDILVLGGGISGITTALEAAEAGYRVTIVEKEPYLGGRVASMNRYFPKLCPPYCGLEINFRRLRENPRIRIYTSSTITKITGEEGNFKASIHTDPIYVNRNCTACGDCSNVCPVERPDDFNLGLDRTRAIYFPHEMAFPPRYVIDDKACLKEECGKCTEVCRYQAIDLAATATVEEIQTGAIVLATGWKLYDARNLADLRFGEHPDVITSLMLERMAALNGPSGGEIVRPSNGKKPGNVAFIQCAGSRDEKYLPYCSGVCCSASLKQALYLTEENPEVTIKIFYIDIRVMGRNEDFLNRVNDHPQIELIKGKVAEIKKNGTGDHLRLEYENILSGKKETLETDLAVLALGIQPNPIELEDVKIDESDFVSPDLLMPGLYAAGCCKKPMDVSMSLKDATGIALKAIQSAMKSPRTACPSGRRATAREIRADGSSCYE